MADRLLNTATFVDSYLQFEHSPGAGMHLGQVMVAAGSEYSVDPLILLAIAGHESDYGKEGAGLDGLLGLAFDEDSDEDNGPEQQIREGARLFQKRRQEGHSSPTGAVEDQLLAVNGAGWSSDASWHSRVLEVYKRVIQATHHSA